MSRRRRSGGLTPVVGLFVAVLFSAFVAVAARGADLPSIIDAVKPSLVVVGYTKATDNPRFTMHGTGFAVGDGSLVVTNAHVLADSATVDPEAHLTLQVRPAGRVGNPPALESRDATVVEVDALHDLVLLRLDGRPLPALAVRSAATVREGQSIALMGFPLGGLLGFAPVTHRGIVSSITPVALPGPASRQLAGRTVRQLRDGSFDVLQLDATAYPGNSGGPLFDVESGEVLGVVNMVFVRETREAALVRPSGISYAIPASHIVELLRRHAAAR